MKKIQKKATLAVAAVAIAAGAASLMACGGPAASGAKIGAGKWPVPDQIYFDVKMQEDIALKDVSEGKTDIFQWAVSGSTFKALPDDIKAKMEVYTVPSTYWSFALNPYPNAAPYTGTADGKEFFNPLAIREVRYALNFLINRKQIVDEVLSGAGTPQFTPVNPGQPNSARYELAANKRGFSPTGDEARALADIETAMQAAAALPANAGKLKKVDGKWTFKGEPVTLKFLIRVDDPNGRLKMGRYAAAQIEKTGISVEKLEWDRKKCISTVYQSNPADAQWAIYTEAWVGGQTYAFWDVSLAQMYAPWYTNMPGNGEPSYWNYKNDELDRLTKNAVTGMVKDEADYYKNTLAANDLGLHEAVRVFLATQHDYFCTAKDRFNSRMPYGMGDGLNQTALQAADIKPVNGKKVLRVSQLSARGALFANPWDPIGDEGFNDTYSTNVARLLTDFEGIADPVTGMYYPLRMTWKDVRTDIDASGEKVVGKIPVDPKAVLWNARTQKWETGLTYADKGDGTYDYVKDDKATAFSTGTYKYKGGKWHHGRDYRSSDFLYANALKYDLSVKKSDDDMVYEASYANAANGSLAPMKGWVLNGDGTVTTYFDVNFPMDPEYLGNQGSPTINLQGTTRGISVTWEIAEALKLLVVEGGESGTKWTFGSAEGLTEVDLLSELCVKDLKAKLQQMIDRKHVPACIADWTKADEAVADYKLALDFVNKYGHGYISNGPYYLEKYDPTNNSAILTAFRDGYGLKDGYAKNLATVFPRINLVKVPSYEKGKDLAVSAVVSAVTYPENKAVPAAKGKVRITLVADAEKTYEATSSKAGSFSAAIPAADLAALAPGTYILIVEAALETGSPAVETATFVVN